MFQLGGVYVSVPPDVSIMSQNALKIYSFITLIILTSNIVLELYLVLFQWEFIRDAGFVALIIFIFSNSLCVTVCFYFKRDELDLFLQRFGKAVLYLNETPICNQKTFLKLSDKLINTLNKYTLMYTGFICLAGVINIGGIYINYWFSINREKVLPIQYPFEPPNSPAYDVILLYQFLSGTVHTLKKCSTESLFAVMFLYLNFCYKHLCGIFENVFDIHETNLDNVSCLQQWIKLHQHFQR